MRTRRLPIPAIAIAICVLCSGAPAAAQLRAELIADGFDRPLAIVADPLLPQTLIVVEQTGLARAVVGGVVRPMPFLDLRDEITTYSPETPELGFLGLAFSPHDVTHVFVCFTNRRDPGLPFDDFSFGDTVVARYQRSMDDPLVLDPSSRFDLRWPSGLPGIPPLPFIYQPSSVHRGGNLVFGPDGYLYIGLGDGGGGNHPFFNAQNPALLLGKMLRIDIRVPPDHPRGYVLPADNPFLDGQPIEALGEIWAFGYRNPWRFSFDDVGPGATGAMIVGDVGQDTLEEIDYEPAGGGGRNYGWPFREGRLVTPNLGPSGPAYQPLIDPIAEYPRSIGRSVTGGYVYRGRALPVSYRGRYFVADFGSGRVFSLGLALDSAGEARVSDVLEHSSELGNPRLIPTFGRDLDGELYFSTFQGGVGRVYRIVVGTAVLPAPPVGLSSAVAGSTVSLTWQPGAGGGGVASYQLEAGSHPGAADLAVIPTPTGEVAVGGVPDGVYFVRVRAVNAAGTSEPSNEIAVSVGCGGVQPAGPPALVASVTSGGVVSLSWSPVDAATSYVVEAGSASGLTDVAAIPAVGTALIGSAPPGVYYVRVRGLTACGPTAASPEVVVSVP